LPALLELAVYVYKQVMIEAVWKDDRSINARSRHIEGGCDEHYP
jgi:hypothetical protein